MRCEPAGGCSCSVTPPPPRPLHPSSLLAPHSTAQDFLPTKCGIRTSFVPISDLGAVAAAITDRCVCALRAQRAVRHPLPPPAAVPLPAAATQPCPPRRALCAGPG